MPDTYVHFKAIKNDWARDSIEPNFWSQKFVCRHDTPQRFREMFNNSINEVLAMQGMIVVKDVNVRADLPTNIMFIPMHRIARIEFEIREITGKYPDGSGMEVKQ